MVVTITPDCDNNTPPTADANGPKHLDVDISRAKFESLTSDLLDRCASPCEQAMGDAKGAKETLGRILETYPDSSAAQMAKQRLGRR